jgi:ribulose-5-phosphate 4-epimerase/fuculose-1-phosphate aldolase
MDEREELVEALKLLVYLGMTNPRGGNGSIKLDDRRILVTPSGIAKHRLTVNMLVEYDLKTGKYRGQYRPSIEVNAHALLYEKEPGARAILHAHTPCTLALTDLGLDSWWKAGLVEVEYSVGKVGIADPAPPGTLELATNIAEKVEDGARLIIVPRHGVFAWGGSVHEALDAIVTLEETAKYVVTRTVLETIKNLSRSV